jgi:formyltetrahydrofolate deformylase
MNRTAVLLIDCPDAKRIVASISTFLYSHGANILSSDQHQDNEAGLFFMRVEFALADFALALEHFASQFQPIADRYRMQWHLEDSSYLPRIAIFVSRDQHCLVDLLHRHQTNELRGQISLVVSNHQDATALAEFYRVPFRHVPVDGRRKQEAETAQIDLMERNHRSWSRGRQPGTQEAIHNPWSSSKCCAKSAKMRQS